MYVLCVLFKKVKNVVKLINSLCMIIVIMIIIIIHLSAYYAYILCTYFITLGLYIVVDVLLRPNPVIAGHAHIGRSFSFIDWWWY